MRRSTSTVRRACALGTTAALVALTTGLGIATATAAHAEGVEQPVTGQSAPADPTQTTAADPAPDAGQTDPAPAGEQTDPPVSDDATADPTTPADDDTDNDTGDDTDTDPSTDADPGAPAGSTAPTRSLLPGTGSTTADIQVAAADPTVAITGDAKVGSTLTASTTGFDKDLAAVTFQWTVKSTGAKLSDDQFYALRSTEAGEVVVVTATGVRSDGTPAEARAATTTVTQDPVFVDGSGNPIEGGTEADEDVVPLRTTAGDAFSYTFRAQGYPAPTYELAWYYGDEEDSIGTVVTTQTQAELGFGVGLGEDEDVNGDGVITPDDQLPKGIEFDPTTGELSGTAEVASWYDFAVTATSGDVTTTQYVELTVDPGAAYGLAAVALDKGLIDDEKGAFYIIRPDGTVVGLDLAIDDDGFGDEGELRDHVSVRQGGTLLVYGTPVDRFGNDTVTGDDESDAVQATVTSNVASDVIAPYTENGAAGFGVSSVTFPHASTHTLTVASEDLQPISFDVEVQPVVAAVAPVAPAATVVTPPTAKGELAYTGSDATDALPWALALVLAGAGMIGVRALRRRHARR